MRKTEACKYEETFGNLGIQASGLHFTLQVQSLYKMDGCFGKISGQQLEGDGLAVDGCHAVWPASASVAWMVAVDRSSRRGGREVSRTHRCAGNGGRPAGAPSLHNDWCQGSEGELRSRPACKRMQQLATPETLRVRGNMGVDCCAGVQETQLC